MNNLTFKVTDEDKIREYKIVKACFSKKFNKNYLIYIELNTDNDEIYASVFDVVGSEIKLSDIETDEEWDYIDEELAKGGK